MPTPDMRFERWQHGTPLVSVLIPAYNAGTWLRETIESVLGQTWPRLEIIVVDDGSQDGTQAVAKEFAKYGVVVRSQANAGPGSARNEALALSSGEYIQYLDADDLISPDKIEASVRVLEEAADPLAFAVCRWARFCDTLDNLDYREEPTFRDWDGPPLMLNMLIEQPAGMQPTGSWLIPRTLCERVGPWPENYLSPIDDGEYLFRLLSVCSRMRFSPAGMLYYRTGVRGLSTLKTKRALEGLYRSYLEMTKTLRSIEESPRTRYATARTFQRFIFATYPLLPARLLKSAEEIVRVYGGAADLEPEGSPRFQKLRKILGWKVARRVEAMWRQLTPDYIRS